MYIYSFTPLHIHHHHITTEYVCTDVDERGGGGYFRGGDFNGTNGGWCPVHNIARCALRSNELATHTRTNTHNVLVDVVAIVNINLRRTQIRCASHSLQDGRRNYCHRYKLMTAIAGTSCVGSLLLGWLHCKTTDDCVCVCVRRLRLHFGIHSTSNSYRGGFEHTHTRLAEQVYSSGDEHVIFETRARRAVHTICAHTALLGVCCRLQSVRRTRIALAHCHCVCALLYAWLNACSVCVCCGRVWCQWSAHSHYSNACASTHNMY